MYLRNLLPRLEGKRFGWFPWNLAGKIVLGSSTVLAKLALRSLHCLATGENLQNKYYMLNAKASTDRLQEAGIVCNIFPSALCRCLIKSSHCNLSHPVKTHPRHRRMRCSRASQKTTGLFLTIKKVVAYSIMRIEYRADPSFLVVSCRWIKS